MIEPKISKKTLQTMSFFTIEKLACLIWNNSLKDKKIDSSIHSSIVLKDLSVFNIRNVLQDMLQISLSEQFDLKILKRQAFWNSCKLKESDFAQDFSYEKLYEIIRNQNVFNFVQSTKKMYKANMLIIAEGVTEELLLSKIGETWQIDFSKAGILIHGAGGKNQAVKAYNEFKDRLVIPILVLLDSDAKENEELIRQILRKKDRIYRIKNGEFEDLLSDELILKSLNERYKMNIKVDIEDLKKENTRKTEVLHELFKEKGLGDFKKAEFSKIILPNISSKEDFSSEAGEIMAEIKSLYKK